MPNLAYLAFVVSEIEWTLDGHGYFNTGGDEDHFGSYKVIVWDISFDRLHIGM